MKKWPLILAGVTLAFAATPYGLTAISYAFIPPEHGYFRNYPNYDFKRQEQYWAYWKSWGPIVGWVSPRENMSGESGELVHDIGHRYFLYDVRNECDGTLTFTRTEMIRSNLDGNEKRYPRVLNLWEILNEYRKANDQKKSHALLAPRRKEHDRLILARMKERNISIRPDAVAQKRPPVIVPPAANTPEQSPIPLLAVTEYGYGDDTGTSFALYADGSAICRSLPYDSSAPYHFCQIPNASQFLKQLVGPNYDQLPGTIKLSGATDQTTTTLWTSEKIVRIYGPWREPDLLPGTPEELTDEDRQYNERAKREWEIKSAGIRSMMQKIDELRKFKGKTWFPPKIEVLFWDYEHARDVPLEWPKNWPGLYDATSKKRGKAYRVYVPSGDYAQLIAFLASRPERGAIMIDLNQMAPSMRLPFPSEETWLKFPLTLD